MTSPDQPERLGALQRNDLARRHTTAAEIWLRRLVHHQLRTALGDHYITTGPWRRTIRDRVAAKIQESPTRLNREVDATTFDELIDIVCHPEFYPGYFSEALSEAYPLGKEEARVFLDRIKNIRNDVSHGRACSARMLEQAVCYSNDLADALKAYFGKVNMAREYDVPLIVRYVDNRGNESTLEGVSLDLNNRIIDWRSGRNGDLRPGDILIAEIEVDPSFDRVEYDVTWFDFHGTRGKGSRAEIVVMNKHVGGQFELRFDVITRRDWHRQHGKDDSLCLVFRVLPPLAT